MPAYSNPGASTVGKCALVLVVNALGQITQSHATSDHCHVAIQRDVLEALQVNHHAAILATRAKGSITVAAALGLYRNFALGSADNCIRNVLNSGGDDDDGGSVSQVEIVRLCELRKVGGTSKANRNILCSQAVGQAGG